MEKTFRFSISLEVELSRQFDWWLKKNGYYNRSEAIRDHYDYYGRGRYEGAVTIGVVIHGFSDYSGHGPGVNPILSALPGRIKIKLDPNANMAYLLGIRK